MIRLLLVLALALACGQAQATTPVSFDAAVEAHEAGQLEAARSAFRRMAENGRFDAQFNLAAMLVNGEGGPGDPVEAALWMSLADEAGYEPAEEASDIIVGVLDDAQRAEWTRRLPGWREKFSTEAVFARHAPVFCADCQQPELSGNDRDRLGVAELIMDGKLTLERKPPRYPRDAASSRTVGIVAMGGWLAEDGTLEQPHVLYSDPEGVFDSNALWAFERWQWEWQIPPEERSSRYILQTIEFKLDHFKDDHRLERNLRQDLERGLASIEADALPAYSAAWTLDFIGLEPDPDRPGLLVHITHQAARQGMVRAQLDLADRLCAGDQVRPDTESCIFWLEQAGFSGDPRAQFLLSFRPKSLGEELAQDYAAAAIAQNYAPAVLAAIRREVQSAGESDSPRLASLLRALPHEWQRRNGDDPLIRRARELVE